MAAPASASEFGVAAPEHGKRMMLVDPERNLADRVFVSDVDAARADEQFLDIGQINDGDVRHRSRPGGSGRLRLAKLGIQHHTPGQ